MPFYPFFGEGPPTKIDYRKKSGTLVLTSLLEGLVGVGWGRYFDGFWGLSKSEKWGGGVISL